MIRITVTTIKVHPNITYEAKNTAENEIFAILRIVKAMMCKVGMTININREITEKIEKRVIVANHQKIIKTLITKTRNILIDLIQKIFINLIVEVMNNKNHILVQNEIMEKTGKNIQSREKGMFIVKVMSSTWN